jgi:phospholipid-binding lipoprotein MlaA
MIVVAAGMLGACATVTTPTKGDPFESYNRTMFTINDKIDEVAFKPAAKAYVWAVPQPVRTSVTNFFSNIGDVYIAANNLLQLKIADGVSDIVRVAMNTVFGVGGLFDVATLAKLPKHTSDFGLTLGHYGVPAGPYFVVPVLGPSTIRDAGGLVVDYFGNPLTYVQPASVSWALYGLNLVDTRANLLGASDVLADAALDKYSFVRNAYLQRRQYLLSGGDGSVPDYGEGEAPLPKYDETEGGASAGAAAAEAASATAIPGTPASGAQPASEAVAAPSPASAPGSTNVPGNQVVPPRIPSFPSIRLR